MKRYSIKDLRKGKVVLKNNGTLGQLKKVLRKAFPKDLVDMENGEAVYYYAGKGGYWGINHIMLNDENVQSVKDFLKPKNKKVKVEGVDDLKMILHAKTVNLLSLEKSNTQEWSDKKNEIEFIKGVIETLQK